MQQQNTRRVAALAFCSAFLAWMVGRCVCSPVVQLTPAEKLQGLEEEEEEGGTLCVEILHKKAFLAVIVAFS